MITEKIKIKSGHYIKEIYENGTINIYPDPDFQEQSPPPVKPPLPNLNTTNKKLDFIINELHLKDRFSQ